MLSWLAKRKLAKNGANGVEQITLAVTQRGRTNQVQVATFVVQMIATAHAWIIIRGREAAEPTLQTMMRQAGGWRREAMPAAANDPNGFYGNHEWASASLIEIWLQGAILGGDFWKISELISNWLNASLGWSEVEKITEGAKADLMHYFRKNI